jgi:phosphoribosylformimino-5-aminoimidazole carboxamide ribotide isomerase
MRILPVLDIRGGMVVRAVAGRRSEYRPLVSRLTDSTDPLAVAEAIRRKFGWSDFYVADLDSIAACGLAIDPGLYYRFRVAGFDIWLDAGVRDADDAERLATKVDRIIVGLETVRDLSAWPEIMMRLGPERAVFSLDLRDGRPLLLGPGALAIAESVVTSGCRHMIVLARDPGRRPSARSWRGDIRACRSTLAAAYETATIFGGWKRSASPAYCSRHPCTTTTCKGVSAVRVR